MDLDDEALLESIDDSSLETSTVKDIAENPKHKFCLDAFCKNYDLVKWIRMETLSKRKFTWFVPQEIAKKGNNLN